MRATTAVILARGLGTRMRAQDGSALAREQADVAARGVKALVPVGRPFIEYLLSSLADAGVQEVVLVVEPGVGALQQHLESLIVRRLQLRFAVQDEPRGTADALAAAAPLLAPAAGAQERREFLMLNADNLYPVEAIRLLVEADGPGLVAFEASSLARESNIEAERIARFALVASSADGALSEIIEKPEPSHPLLQASERWVSMNLWRFGPSVFGACERVSPSPRGELELADAVRLLISDGERLTVHHGRGAVLDLSHQRDIAGVAERLRDREVVL